MPRLAAAVLVALFVAGLVACTAPTPTPASTTAVPTPSASQSPSPSATIPTLLEVSVPAGVTPLAQLSSQHGTAETSPIGPIDGSIAVVVTCSGPASLEVDIGGFAGLTRSCDDPRELQNVYDVEGRPAFVVRGSAEDSTIWALTVTLP